MASRTRLITALTCVLLAFTPGTLNAAGVADPRDELAAKADPGLIEAVASGVGEVEVIVTGRPHVGVREASFPDRASAMLELDRRSEPFFAEVRRSLAASGGREIATWSAAPAMKVSAGLATLDDLAELDDVRTLTLDHSDVVRIDPLPGDPFTTSNSGGRAMIQTEDVWALGFRGQGIKLSVIDTGIDASHEAFKTAAGATRVANWIDLVGGSPNPYDDNGHGTHTAGTSAGSSDFVDPQFGAFQETGVAPQATLMVAKFLNAGGSGSLQAAMDALQWSFDRGADITSNSWGSSCSAATGVMALVRQLTDLGMLSVFAAGNSGPFSGSIGGPGCGESSLTVGAVDSTRQIASFSSRGPCSDPDLGTASRICPDVVAKGVNVRSSVPRSGAGLGDASGYRSLNGTSMATPHVAGAAVLAEQMKRVNTGTGWNTAGREEEDVFKQTTVDLGPTGEDNDYGWGLPQLKRLHDEIVAPVEPRIVHTFSISSAELRLGEETALSFSVRNLVDVEATGDFLATLTDPTGAVTVLRSTTPSLRRLDEERIDHAFAAVNDVRAGTYTFRGSFDYEWTDPSNGQTRTAAVSQVGTFDVRRPFVTVAVDGLEPVTTPLDLQSVTFTVGNAGNESATDVVLDLTMTTLYVFVPGQNLTLADLKSRYSDPAPARTRDSTGWVTLSYDVGTLAPGASFQVHLNLLPTVPTEYLSISLVNFRDGLGQAFSQERRWTQTVALS